MDERTETPDHETPRNVRVVIPREWYIRPWLLGLFLAFALLMLYTVRDWIGPLVVSFLLLALLYSLNERLVVKLGGRRALASTASLTVLVLAVFLPFYFVVRLFVSKGTELQAQIEPQMAELRLQFQEAVAAAGAGSEVAGLLDELSAALYKLALSIGASLLSGTVSLLLYGIVMLFILFFLLRDTPTMLDAARKFSPIGPRNVDFLARRFKYVTVGVLKGVIVVALVQSAIGGLTLALVGVPGVWFWTILMAVLSLIPLFGTWLVMYPIAFIEIANGNVVEGVIIILVTLFVITTVDNILRPILVGQQAKMHTLVALLATIGGMMVFGAIGVFVGPVIAALFIAMLEIYHDELMPPPEPVEMADAAPGTADLTN